MFIRLIYFQESGTINESYLLCIISVLFRKYTYVLDQVNKDKI